MTATLNKIMACLTPYKINILIKNEKENEIQSILAFFEADTVGHPTVTLKVQKSYDDEIIFNLQCEYPILGKDGVWLKDDDTDIVTAVRNYLTNVEKFIRLCEYEKGE